MPTWRKGERRLQLKVMSLGLAEGGSRTSQMEDEFFSADVDDRRVTGETQLLLGVSAHGRQWRCLQETKRNRIRGFSVSITKGREWRKQF